MQAQRSSLSKFLSYIFILITGVGIGWLMGLSISPVVSIVITSLTGSAAAIIATMSGINKKTSDADQSGDKEKTPTPRWDVNPLPLALLVVGIIVGSISGVFARNNDLLGSDLLTEIQKWSAVGIPEREITHRLFERHFPLGNQLAFRGTTLTESNLSAEIQKWSEVGIPEQDIARRLFEIQFPLSNQLVSTPEQGPTLTTSTVLFTVSADQCGTLRAASIRAQVGDPDALADALRRIKELEKLPDVVSDSELLRDIVEVVICPEN